MNQQNNNLNIASNIITFNRLFKSSVSEKAGTPVLYNGNYCQSFLAFIICVIIACNDICIAQNRNFNNIYQSLEDNRYEDVINSISTIDISSLENDMTKSELMYLKGVALYESHKYKESIPYLIEGLFYTKATNSESSCEYIENLYGIGSAFYHSGDFKNAESYFRKSIIAVRQLPYKCKIITQLFSELAQCYVKTGHPDLADICIQEGESEVHSVSDLVDWEQDIENKYDLIEEYVANGLIDKAENTYKSIMDVIETNVGVLNEDYILYGYSFGRFYQKLYDWTNPNVLYEANQWYAKVLNSARQFNNQIDKIYGIYGWYLTSLAWLNKEEEVHKLFSEALDYYTKCKSVEELDNLYLRVGESFFSADNSSQCIAYLGEVLLDRKNFRVSENTAISMLLDCMYLTQDSRIMDFLDVSYPHMIEQLGQPGVNLRLFFEDAMFTYKQSDHHEKAIKAGQIALDLCKMENQPRHLLTILTDLIALTYPGDRALAELYIMQAERLLDNPEILERDILSYTSTKGFVYIMTGQYRNAVNLLSEAVKFHPVSSSNLAVMANLYHNLGRAYMLISEYKSAYDSLKVAMEFQSRVYGNVSERTQMYFQECESFIK